MYVIDAQDRVCIVLFINYPTCPQTHTLDWLADWTVVCASVRACVCQPALRCAQCIERVCVCVCVCVCLCVCVQASEPVSEPSSLGEQWRKGSSCLGASEAL